MTEQELIAEFYRWERWHFSPEIREAQLPSAAFHSLLDDILWRSRSLALAQNISGISVIENSYLPPDCLAFVGPEGKVLGIVRIKASNADV